MGFNLLAPFANPLDLLWCQLACMIPFESQHPIVFHPWAHPCLMLIEGEFVCKGVEQFDH
jgi:hypothetical protein